MVRFNYYDIQKKERDLNIYDLTTLNWNEFQFKRGVKKIRLSFQEIDKFYLVTQTYYDSLVNEDLIYFINRISDPTELFLGQEILLPDILDVSDFIFQQTGIKY